MTDKLTPKQERFWIEYLATGNASEAYRRAYNTCGMNDRTIQKRAGELLVHGVIAGRIAETRARAEANGICSLAEHMQELETLREIAKKNGQAGAAVSAEVKRGELMGFYVQRRGTTTANYTLADTPMTEEEWEEKYGVRTPAGMQGRKH